MSDFLFFQLIFDATADLVTIILNKYLNIGIYKYLLPKCELQIMLHV
jgi:hypothetical protein